LTTHQSQSPESERLVPGQRFVSETEPELGLGTLVELLQRRMVVAYRAAGERREYALESAPLQRVRFRPGDKVTARNNRRLTVKAVTAESGLLHYETVEGRRLCETDLADSISFSTPEERILSGHVDPSRLFDLRRRSLDLAHERRRSPVRGFIGGRIELIPHQLFIASEATARRQPRVLLADEVGLGKAIEACLIIHRLLEIGRAARVLIVVPDALVLQWFVELLRRFALHAAILDDRSWETESGAPRECNPFEEDSLVLCALPLLRDAQRARQAVAAGWDLLVVDEAHRLRWAPGRPSAEYRIVEALAKRAAGVLLLTATPEQLGLQGHFARLRLLDPSRYTDFGAFEREVDHYREVARVASALLGGRKLTSADRKLLHRVLGAEPDRIQERLEGLAQGDTQARESVVMDLIDRHGPGRAIFRNTRAAIKGFPRRMPRPAPLVAPEELEDLLPCLAREFDMDRGEIELAPSHDLTLDPRLLWLADLLRRTKDAKILLICRTPQKVRAIQAALERHVKVKTALFHEGLDLIQRDRQAAWFAEDEGARLLLASEIGSEGRNFQFAHHLVLFDLPLDPELLEQRIGRLDRIGQKANITIHIPYVEDTAQEVLFRWHHEGLDGFAHHLHTGRAMLEAFGAQVSEVAELHRTRHRGRRQALTALLRASQAARLEQERQLAQSRDRLLELGSCRPKSAALLVDRIRQLDQDDALDSLMQEIWSHFGVSVDELAPRSYRLGRESGYVEGFPNLPGDGLSVTLDRRLALGREDMAFLTWDHPMVTGALDLLLGRRDGNAALTSCPTAGERGIWLEALFVLECIAPQRLHTDRFLPPTPVPVIVDGRALDVSQRAAATLARTQLHDIPAHALRGRLPFDRSLLKRLLGGAQRIADGQRARLIATARASTERELTHELDRLRALAAVNPSVRKQEIAAVEHELGELLTHYESARLRLDAVRLILLGDA
jgi:ATP-dependent helicase HepA